MKFHALDKLYTSCYLKWLQLKLLMGDVKKQKDLHLLANNNSIPKYAFLKTEYLQSTDKHNKNPAK